MTTRSPTKDGRRPRVVGVIMSQTDLDLAIRMRERPDLFELRLDHLVRPPSVAAATCGATDIADELEEKVSRLRAPLIVTARHPQEGGANKLNLRQRRDLLSRFLPHARYIDIELRSAAALHSLSKLARKKNVRRIISFHDLKATPDLARLAGQSAQGEIAWRRYFQSCNAHRHTSATRAIARFHHKERSRSCRKRDGNRQTWRNFARSARLPRLGSCLRLSLRRE